MTMIKKQTFIIKFFKQLQYDLITTRTAEISFYLLLSFFPFLIFIITVICYIPILHLNPYIDLFSRLMPSNASSIVNYIIQKAISDKSLRLLIASAAITLWSGTNAVAAVIRGINKAYDTVETRSFLRIKFISQVFVMMIVLMIALSFILIVYGDKLGTFINHNFIHVQQFLILWNSTRYLVDIFTLLLMFILLYKYTPNKHLKIIEILPGVLVSTIGWIVFSMLFSYYANHFINYNLLYGSIGGIIALLSWIYFSSMILLVGAEINATSYFQKNGRMKERTKIY